MSVKQFFLNHWYQSSPGILRLLAPLSWLVGYFAAKRFSSRQLGLVGGVPVIVIGNITVGGTGKTPLIASLIGHFQAKGLRVGVISRGYGGSLSGEEVVKVHRGHSAAEVGDEPLIHFSRGAAVFLCAQRAKAAELAARECDVILADDGLQHYPLIRTVEVCVLDGERKIGNGALLPMGPLREPESRLANCDLVVVNHGDSIQVNCSIGHEAEFTMTVAPGEWRAVNDQSLQSKPNTNVTLISGIGNPDRFEATVKSQNIAWDRHIRFGDHHAYRQTDFIDATSRIVMTEKDAVKAISIAPQSSLYITIKAELGDEFYSQLDALLSQKQQEFS
ncbi:tetraacyldisaccharide 4'-kinase [Umboniibacter marinipuniceus]|uniref:Tetraacyldisaccharide 4'-kinase n=1 Tax=Umboniibacter marinipuniceus TaxID=569599 RepID=A0A3M0AQA1_9GAMM|nr:tetraacyldisaccharide 4'-kinase [Umboniibacter marinipuniceus]RMA81172.1 lipid-A-disaccharide kinase [Umboniibacter marinipuniceus]